jgi:hypothetical protein
MKLCSSPVFYFYLSVALPLFHVVVAWLRRLAATLSPRWPGLAPGSLHVGFVVDKVALLQVFDIITPWLSILIYHNRPVGGRSSETQSHLVNMNNTNKCITSK